MSQIPRGGIIGRSVHCIRRIARLHIGLYAANASFFILLAVFPGLMLLLGLLRHTPYEVAWLGEFMRGILPEVFEAGAEEILFFTYDNSTGAVLGISAITALWSASRGTYGLIAGMNAVYHVSESRNYFRRRILSMAYTFAFFLVLLLTLGLHIFSTELIQRMERGALAVVIDLRFPLLLVVQTMTFAAMYMVLPSQKNTFQESLPGAVLAALLWHIFSDLYSVYVEHFAGLTHVYGSLYAVPLTMLWLYCCISIVFYGGVVNHLLKNRRQET